MDENYVKQLLDEYEDAVRQQILCKSRSAKDVHDNAIFTIRSGLTLLLTAKYPESVPETSYGKTEPTAWVWLSRIAMGLVVSGLVVSIIDYYLQHT